MVYQYRRVREGEVVFKACFRDRTGIARNWSILVSHPLRISLQPRDRIRWASAGCPASGLHIECVDCSLERLQSTHPKNIGNLRFSSQLEILGLIFWNIAPTCTNQLCMLVVEFGATFQHFTSFSSLTKDFVKWPQQLVWK